MESNLKEKKGFVLKKMPKPVGIGIFYGICILVAAMVLLHNNPWLLTSTRKI